MLFVYAFVRAREARRGDLLRKLPPGNGEVQCSQISNSKIHRRHVDRNRVQ